MDFIIENWYMVVGLLACGGVLGYGVLVFSKRPRPEQIAMIMELLYVLVKQAQGMFASDEGKKKLQYVYDEAVKIYPFIKRLVPFETFKVFVNEALYYTGIWVSGEGK